MDKKNFVRSVAEVMHTNGVKKPVSIPKQVFHISDDDGNSKDFTVKTRDKTVYFTVNDVAAVVDACVYVIMDALKRGDYVNFSGFGRLGLNYRKPRKTKQFGTGEEVEIKGRYVPKFSFGNDLRMCAKMYELSLSDKTVEPEPVYDETDEIDEAVLNNGA